MPGENPEDAARVPEDSKMKAAFVQSISAGWLIGAAAMLEQLKRHGHTEDVWILYWDDVDWKRLSSIIDNSGYEGKVCMRPIKEIREWNPVDVPQKARRGWDCRFYKYLFAARGLDDVDVACFWGGDVLPLWNLESHLRLARNFIVLSNNAYSKTKMHLVHGGGIANDVENPYTDVPTITSSRVLLEKIWEKGQQQAIRERGRGDMRCVYEAIDELGFHRWVWLLPYSCWVHPWRFYKNWSRWEDGGFGFPDGVRIFAVHSKLWSRGHCEKESRKYGVPIDKLLDFRSIYERAGEIHGFDQGAFR